MFWQYLCFASDGCNWHKCYYCLLCHTARTTNFTHEEILIIQWSCVFFRLYNSVTASTATHNSPDVFTNTRWLDIFCTIQVNEIRRKIIQSPSFKLADTELNDYIKAMTTLLTDPSRLATDALTMQAVVQLQRVIYYVCYKIGKFLSQKQRKTKQNIHFFLHNRYVLYLYTQYKLHNSRALQMATKILYVCTLFLHDQYGIIPSVQNANSENPANT